MAFSDGKLTIPIQINGGDNAPTKLLDRELFIYKPYNSIRIGQSDGTVQPLVAERYGTKTGNVYSLLYHDGVNIRFGNIHNENAEYNLFNAENSIISNLQVLTGNIMNCKLDSIRSLNAHSDIYGSEFPTSGKQGDIFFLVGE